ncbi:hypothetical protein BDU57DRAFT_523285 [Ampelomyces quisqualis]|uniref:Secreted protein n=1 Tax=Ampelomyces quisqualis TaxID=50730 RepID=A0A6A5Q9H5_AMPQU|nr:hypothetical protein BDU57DRAFT_523285 [Ampelomyces quisqualis]
MKRAGHHRLPCHLLLTGMAHTTTTFSTCPLGCSVRKDQPRSQIRALPDWPCRVFLGRWILPEQQVKTSRLVGLCDCVTFAFPRAYLGAPAFS